MSALVGDSPFDFINNVPEAIVLVLALIMLVHVVTPIHENSSRRQHETRFLSKVQTATIFVAATLNDTRAGIFPSEPTSTVVCHPLFTSAPHFLSSLSAESDKDLTRMGESPESWRKASLPRPDV
jgi:hypothetical protein